jgi:MFS family permease
MLLVARFITGLGSGMVNSTVPLYQSEIAPPKIRGHMVGLHGTLLVAGYAMAGWAGYGCYFEPNQQIQWRLLLALQVVTPGMLLCASPFLPESPRYQAHEFSTGSTTNQMLVVQVANHSRSS